MNKNFALNAMIGAVYAVTTILIAPIAYGNIQFRLSEILLFLAFYNKKFIPGLVIGCMIANTQSSLGIIDVLIGGCATFIVVYICSKCKSKWAVPVVAAAVNGLFVGGELTIFADLPFIETAIFVAAGEWFAVMVGVPVFHYLMKNSNVRKYILD